MKIRYVYLVQDVVEWEGSHTEAVFLDEASAVTFASGYDGTDGVKVVKWDLETQTSTCINFRRID